jgi:predicted Fe-S protein YdhL (DUF1289 family)
MNDERAIFSPCVRVCRLDPGAPLCIGCFRTLEEIAGWTEFSDSQREAVLEKLAARRATYTSGHSR